MRYADGGLKHSMVLTQDGRIFTMGDNTSGQLGRLDGDSSTGQVDLSVLGNQTVIQAHAEGDLTMILTNLGNVYVFGFCNGSCGAGLTMQIIPTPTPIQLIYQTNLTLNVSRFFMGDNVVFFQDAANMTYSMGRNDHGQLCQAIPTILDKNVYTLSWVNLLNASSIQASQQHTIFLKGGLVCGCGDSSKNRMGNISKQDYIDPIVIWSGPNAATAIGVTMEGSYILTGSGLFSTG